MFAQRFLRLSETRPRTKVKVNQTSVEVKTNSVTHKPSSLKQHQKYASHAQSKQAPAHFICSTPNTEQCHLLYNCTTYQHMTPHKTSGSICQSWTLH